SEASYTANQVSVRVAARPYTSVVGNTPVQQSYARLLDGNRAAYSTLRGTYDLLDLASVGTIQSSLEAIAPRSETMRRAIGTTAVDNIARFYRDRLAAMEPENFAGGTLTMTGAPMQFAANALVMPGQAAQVSDTSTSIVRENVLPSTVSAFLAGGYLTGSGRAMPGAAPQGTRDDFDGFFITGGVEAQVDDDSVLGFGLSYSDIDGERNFGQSARGESIQGTLYGRYGERFGPSFDAQVSAGVFKSQTHRVGTFAGTPFDLRSRDNAFTLSSEVGASYGLGSDQLRIAPRVAVRTSQIDFTPTIETGTGPALFYDKDKFLSIQGRAGLTLDARESGLRPIASAYFVHDFQDRADRFQAGFVGGTAARAPFLVASQDRNWGEMSFGFSYRTPSGLELSAAADSTFARSDVRNQAFRAGLRAPF
ncbi:MAG: autotransporter outer membrane beta-barrel domain-containing protein, partial [Sphingomonadales bacterium]|nr:autotransporter outer membrane beta-barrel domain-containing protein [Sphingomonadales bacterium]